MLIKWRPESEISISVINLKKFGGENFYAFCFEGRTGQSSNSIDIGLILGNRIGKRDRISAYKVYLFAH